MIALGFIHRRIELDEHLASSDRLPVADMNRAYNPRLKRLDHFGAPARDDLSRRRRNDVDLTERSPG